MPFKIITVPFEANGETFDVDTINNFCINKNVKGYKTEFFSTGIKQYWSVFIEYEPVLEPGAPEDGLTEPEKLLFNRLREWRREKADEKGVPVYIICTNKILRDIVKRKPETKEALKLINGFGEKKAKDFGGEILELLRAFNSDVEPQGRTPKSHSERSEESTNDD